jgi:hypothetical protein
VLDPECLSRIPDPETYPSRILDPKTATKEKICYPTFFVAPNITKLKLILFLNWPRKKLGPIYQGL